MTKQKTNKTKTKNQTHEKVINFVTRKIQIKATMRYCYKSSDLKNR